MIRARACVPPALCAIAILLGMSAPATAQLSSGSPELISKNLVDIGGGRHMNIVCNGQGSPATVFLYGGNASVLDWAAVQVAVSGITRACFYDRAGFGYSDPSPRPMTANNIVDDLHTVLAKAGIARPVVLIGHSSGGLYATLYADKFTSQVAGLVLIDPAFAGSADHETGQTAAERLHFKDEFERGLAHSRACADLARVGKLSAVNPHGCFRFAPGRTPAEIAYLLDQYLKPFLYESQTSEAINGLAYETGTSEDGREEEKAARSFGHMPVIVLSRGLIDPDPGYTAAEEEASFKFWRAGHAKLAARSTRGELIVVPNTTHGIQLEQPQAVVDAIQRVVVEVRASATH